MEVLQTVPALCPTVLKDPEPKVWYDGFGDSGINMTLAVWFLPANLMQTKNDVFIAMKKVFDEIADTQKDSEFLYIPRDSKNNPESQIIAEKIQSNIKNILQKDYMTICHNCQ